MDFFDKLKGACPSACKDEPMKNHTTFQAGGPADYFVTPESVPRCV